MKRFKFGFDSRTICVFVTCFALFYSTSFAQDQQQEEVPLPEVRALSASGETVDPIEALFGKGYICLHIDDPKHAASPAFQAFALELAKKYNKTTKVEVGSNETDVHEHVTWKPPPVNIGSDEDSDEVTLSKNKHKPTRKPKQDVADTGKKIKPRCTEPGFFVHPIHCNKYIRCVGPVGKSTKYKLYNFVCGPGTIFDESMSTCNHPRDVDPKPPCWEHEGEPDTDDEDDAPPPGQTEQSPEDGDTDDPPPDVVEDSGESLTKVKTKPKKPKGEDDGDDWIPKLPGRPTKEKDPAKLKDQKKKIKDALDNIITKTKNKPKRKTTTPPPPVEDDDDDDDDEDDGQQVEEETPICAERGTFPYERSCRKFYQCVANKGSYELIAYDCDHGEIYDPKEEECRPRKLVVPKPKNCRKKKRTSTTTTVVETEDTEDESEEPDTVTTRERTSMYPQTSSEEASDEDTSKPHPHCEEEGTFSHPTNCSKFYQCEKKDGSEELERKNFICEKGSIFDGKMCTHASSVKPKPPCAEHDPRYSPKSKAKKKIEEIQALTKTKSKPKRPKGNVNDDQQQAVIDDTNDNKSHEVVDESSEALTKVKNKPKKKNNQTTTDEVVEYEYEEFTDDKGVVKTRKRRTKGHEEYEYETTTDEDGNVVRVKKPKGPTDDEEYETIVDKDGKTIRRRKKKTTTTTVTEDVSYEDDDDETPGKPKKPKKKKPTGEDDEYEIIEKDGKKIRRRKKKVTTTTTTETTDDEDTDNDSGEEGGLTKLKNKPPKKKPTGEEDDEFEIIEKDGKKIRRRKKNVTTTTTNTTTETSDEDPDNDTEEVGLTKLKNKPPRKNPSTQESHETDIDTIIDEDGNSTKKKRKSSTKTTTTTTEEHESHEDSDNPDDDDDTPAVTKVKSKPKRKPGTNEEDTNTTTSEPPHDCPDDSELIARLTRERDEAVANAANLMATNAKLIKDMTKLNKSLEAAVRAKIAAQEHMKKMDKTIESYKQDSEWLKSCCDEKQENEAAARDIAKSRKRRSVLLDSIEEALSKRRFISRVAREKETAPEEIGSEELDEPARRQAGASFEQEAQLTTTTPSTPDEHHSQTPEPEPKKGLNNQTKSSNSKEAVHGRSTSIFTRELPLLIFIFLTLLLFSVVFLGCYIIKKLNRMTTFAISPEELDEYCKQHDGHLHNCSLTHKKKLYRHSDSYFAYANANE